MSATNFNTSNDTFRKLMGNGLIYRIPRFQRDYSWTEEEWEDLWLDILGTFGENGEPAHYMGYLVLQSSDEKTFDVIDGQQRLTTLSLIILAVLKILKQLIDQGIDSQNTAQRLNQIRQSYIGYLDPVTLVAKSKLTLNRNNDNYYQNYLIPLITLPKRGFKASENLLRNSFEWFEKKIRDFCPSTGDKGMSLAKFVETMSDRLFFTVIRVTDELNAYKVFETLNSRGVRLSTTDLLKNYLFSVLHRNNEHEHEIKVAEERWEAMAGRLGSESFPDFLRVHWNSRYPYVRQNEIFKVIRGKINSREGVFTLLRQMEEDLDSYLGLTQPEISHLPKGMKDKIQILRLFRLLQPLSLLVSARRYFGDEDFESLLWACVVIAFRYNVIGNLHTNEQERVYNGVAEKISSGTLSTVANAIKSLSSLYQKDKTFKAAFADKILKTTRNRRVVRYILCELENLQNQTGLDFDSDTFTIEHILPENPGAGWESISDAEHESSVYRLGNMTLLNKGRNKDIGNGAYTEKKKEYEKSPFKITQMVAEENSQWNPERIAARQEWMAKQALTIWRLAQLS